ncbi:MAG: LPXTG cell wall anchor domain-containing protein [Ilumatobacteraceae bacterium]|nr:LPXTG cell wall anchor domain-containing protein [Ilumatobacteraceae bacterium]
MNARKSLTTTAIASVALFSLFGSQAAQAAPGGNGRGNDTTIELGPAPVSLHNDRAEVNNDCPSDAAWWHFVVTPNNGQYDIRSMNLNIGGSATLITRDDIVTNGGQTDNVFVAVPAGSSPSDLTAAGSSAMVAPFSAKVKFVLSHVCEGDAVAEEDEVIGDDAPSDEDITEEAREDEIVEEEPIDEPIVDESVTEIIVPTPDTEDATEVLEVEETAVDDAPEGGSEPAIKVSNETPQVTEAKDNTAATTNNVEVTAIVEEAPLAEAASDINVAADDTNHSALPATGMELSLTFLGLGLAGLGGALLAARRRVTII